jgi:hypothetical protein
MLVAESFSGPLAVLVAAQCESVAGWVLVATFVESPLPSVIRHCPQFMWRNPPPAFLLPAVLTGGDAPLAAAVRRAILLARGLAAWCIATRVLGSNCSTDEPVIAEVAVCFAPRPCRVRWGVSSSWPCSVLRILPLERPRFDPSADGDAGSYWA